MIGRRLRLGIAVVVMAVLPAAALATCLPEAASADQMPCCQGKQHDCDAGTITARCCPPANAAAAQFVVAHPAAKMAPMMVVAHIGDRIDVPTPDSAILSVRGFHSALSPPPLFQLNLSLRI